jgi:hypothetical protein
MVNVDVALQKVLIILRKKRKKRKQVASCCEKLVSFQSFKQAKATLPNAYSANAPCGSWKITALNTFGAGMPLILREPISVLNEDLGPVAVQSLHFLSFLSPHYVWSSWRTAKGREGT